MRTPGWLGVILALLIALIAGGIGFAIGTTTTLPADAAGAVTTVPVAWGWAGWGFPFFPLIGFLFVVMLIVLVVGGARRAAWRGGYGPHAWGPGPGDPRRQMFDDWHRRAHGEPGQPTPQPSAPAPPWPPTGQPPDAPPPVGQPPYGQPPLGDPNARR